jgi:hypothetical protein
MTTRDFVLPKKLKLPRFWSLSRYNVWRECARKYVLQHVMKLPVPKHPAMLRGIDTHGKAEAYLKGEVRAVPKEVVAFKKELMKLKKLRATPEVSWTLTEDEKQCSPTDWNRAWLRAKIDAHHYFVEEREALVVDYKTGGLKVTVPQMDLYAAMTPFFFPDVESILVELWFTDHDHIEPRTYDRREAKRLWERWRRRADVMLGDKTFLPSPGTACNYCPFKSSKKMQNGEFGPCHAWKKRVE